MRRWRGGGALANGNGSITDQASVTDERPEPYSTWGAAPWAEVEAHVSKLQTRIARATKEGRVEEARKAQRMLVAPFDAKLLAVRTATTSKGGNTPGVDGELWKTPKSRMDAAKALAPRGYRAEPLRRVRIPRKGKGGEARPLGIPAMRGRAMQALHALALDPVAEATADRCSFGFRKGRSAQDAGVKLFPLLAREGSPAYVLEGGIRGCFDHISHGWLMARVPTGKRVLAQFLKAGSMERGDWREADEGTPQGGIISPMLANMALDGMEKTLAERFMLGKGGRRHPGKARMNEVNLVRYAGDFVITAKTPEAAAEAKALVEGLLAERGLGLSEGKTLVTHVDEGSDFLGWNFRKCGGELLIRPSEKSVGSFVREMRRCILRDGKAMSQDDLIRTIAPKIRGFANYHRHICASEAFVKTDNVIHFQLERWACRRHPKKGKGWVYGKYWRRKGGSKYIFGTEERFLPHMARQHIVRHRYLEGSMNPYLDHDYFAARKALLEQRRARSSWMPASKAR